MSAGAVPPVDGRDPVRLLDERDPVPVRARIGALLERAATADFAITRIRLRALDLTAAEVAGVQRCRVVLGRLDAATLLDSPDERTAVMAERLRVLHAFASSGRLEVRAAGMAMWTPDFSVFTLLPEATPARIGLVGAHYFQAPYPTGGPTLTAVVRDPDGAALMANRFEEIWEAGHDVLPAIRDALEEAHALAMEAGRRGGRADGPDAAVRPGRDG